MKGNEGPKGQTDSFSAFPSRSSFSATTPSRPPIFHPDLVSLQLGLPGLHFSIQIYCKVAVLRVDFSYRTSAPKFCSCKVAVLRVGFPYRTSARKFCSCKVAVLRVGFPYRTSARKFCSCKEAVLRVRQFFAWASLTVQYFAVIRLQSKHGGNPY